MKQTSYEKKISFIYKLCILIAWLHFTCCIKTWDYLTMCVWFCVPCWFIVVFFPSAIFVRHWRCKSAQMSCHRESLVRFSNTFMLSQGDCCPRLWLLQCWTDGERFAPADCSRHNVLSKVVVHVHLSWCDDISVLVFVKKKGWSRRLHSIDTFIIIIS